MTKEERNALRDKIHEFDAIERRIESAKCVLDRMQERTRGGVACVNDLINDVGIPDDHLKKMTDALRPIIAELLERDIQRIQELRVE